MSGIVNQIEHEIDRLGDREFENLTRSTIPLLCYWRIDPYIKCSELAKSVGMNLQDQPILRCGFEVAGIPDARASETDLMVTAPGVALAIEAKWSESRYDTVAEWRQKVSRGILAVNHWLKLIEPFSEAASHDVDDLVYQMLHRCASACSGAGAAGIAGLVYQVFTGGPHRRDFYEEDLKSFVRVIRPKPNLRVALQRVEATPTSQYRDLLQSLPADPKERAQIIRDAVRSGELFDFKTVPPIRLA
jgi:hypothetical protein